MDEKELAKCLVRYRQEGDTEAIERFFEQTAHRLWPLAMHLSSSASDADDLLQETYLAAIESVRRYDPDRSPWGWLTAILTNKARYRHRQESRVIDPERLSPTEAPEPAAAALSEEERSILDHTVSKLPELYRQVIELLLRRDMSPAEIAQELGRNPGAVRTQLHRGMGLLRRALPSGFAMPAMFVGFESGSFESIRDKVMAHAEAHATATLGVTAGLSKTAILATLLIAGSAAIAVPVVAALSSDPRAARESAELAALPPVEEPEAVLRHAIVVEQQPPEAAANTAPKERKALPVAADLAPEPETPREKKPAKPRFKRPRSFELDVKHGEGLDLRLEKALPGRRDLNIDEGGQYFSLRHDISDRVMLTNNEPALALLDLPPVRIERTQFASIEAHFRSIVSVDPKALEWKRRIRLDPDRGSILVLRHENGLALIAEVNRYRDRNGEQISELHVLNQRPELPFRRSKEAAQVRRGVSIDPTAFESDPYEKKLARRKTKQFSPLLRAVDREAAAIAHDGLSSPLTQVRGVLLREHAGRVSSLKYERTMSSFSFDHDALGGAGDPAFRVETRAVVKTQVGRGDKSPTPVDLGDIVLTDPIQLSLGPDLDLEAHLRNECRLQVGHSYVFHTQDGDTDRYDLVRVVEVYRDEWAVFRWLPIEPPTAANLGILRGRSHASALNGSPGKAMPRGMLQIYERGD